MYTILITGINGFLGSNVAKRLSINHTILGLVRNPENLHRIKGNNFEIYKSDEAGIKELFEKHKVDVVIHTATSYGRNNQTVDEISQTNFQFPLRLLDMAIKNGVKAFINSDTVLDRFVNLYSLTKCQFADWLYFRSNQIKVINLQLEHFYGPGCDNTNFITMMIGRLKNNESHIDLTKGEQKRDFIYFDDTVDAYELMVNKIDSLANAYNNFQVGSGKVVAIKELLNELKKLTNSSTLLNFGAVPYRENELMISTTDNSGLVALGWQAKTTLTEGLKKTI